MIERRYVGLLTMLGVGVLGCGATDADLPFSIAVEAAGPEGPSPGACLLAGANPGAFEARTIGGSEIGPRPWVLAEVVNRAREVRVQLLVVDGGEPKREGSVNEVLAERTYDAAFARAQEVDTWSSDLGFSVTVTGLGHDHSCPLQ